MTRQGMKPNVRLPAALLLLIAVFVLSRQLSSIQGQPAQTANVPMLADGDESKGDPARAQEARDGDMIQPTKSVARAKRPAITDLVPVQTTPSAQWTIDEEFHRGRSHRYGKIEKRRGEVGYEGASQYIIDHYHKLPETIIFLHSHRDGIKGWHTEFYHHSNVKTVRMLNVDFVQRNGYVNLRCDWYPGCPDEEQTFREPRDEGRHVEHVFPDTWHYLFNGTKAPEIVAVPCCAQFAVSRKQILEHPLSDYLQYHRWVMETPWDDDTSGRVMEYMWHIIFGQEPVYCPAMEQCCSDGYGICDPNDSI